jgi:hypothetical protein
MLNLMRKVIDHLSCLLKKIHGLSDDDDENFSFSNTSTAYVVFLIPVVCMQVTPHTLLVAISY